MRELKFELTNKTRYSVSEDVTLRLRTKNLKILTADVYEISTEQHYLRGGGPIDPNISTDFLEPTKRLVKEM